jgi:hypothetical protein
MLDKKSTDAIVSIEITENEAQALSRLGDYCYITRCAPGYMDDVGAILGIHMKVIEAQSHRMGAVHRRMSEDEQSRRSKEFEDDARRRQEVAAEIASKFANDHRPKEQISLDAYHLCIQRLTTESGV